MKPSSQNSEPRRRLKAEKEQFAMRAIFNAMYAIGVSVTNAEEAEQAIDLAAKLMSYALGRKVQVKEVKAKMAALVAEWLERAEAETKH